MTLESLFANVECFIRLATVKIFRVGVEICKKYCKESISFFPLKQPSCKLLQLNKIFSAFKRPKNNFLLITESAMRKKLKNHFQIFFFFFMFMSMMQNVQKLDPNFIKIFCSLWLNFFSFEAKGLVHLLGLYWSSTGQHVILLWNLYMILPAGTKTAKQILP